MDTGWKNAVILLLVLIVVLQNGSWFSARKDVVMQVANSVQSNQIGHVVTSAASMFPSWPHFLNHYKWQVELKFHACRMRDPLVRYNENCKGMESTTPEKELRGFYVDELQRRIRVDSRLVSRSAMMRLPFGDFCTVCGSMVGHPRFANVRHLLQLLNSSGHSGNFVETGVWRGGMSLYARMLQRYFFNPEAHVYLCDSFAGLPAARTNLYSTDGDFQPMETMLGVALPHVKKLFADYDVLDEKHVHFRKGFFVDSMPHLREELIRLNRKISILRLDGDMYESTIDVLYHLYDLVEVGGWIIVDDWKWYESPVSPYFGAQAAIFDFRQVHGIEDVDHAMIQIKDDDGAFFRKARDVPLRRDLYPKNVKPTRRMSAKEGMSYVAKWNSRRSSVWNDTGLW